MNKNRRPAENINAGSMADIAFLLLIFFLVATTISTEEGIPVMLPGYYEGPPGSVAERNVFSVLINSENQLLVEDEIMHIDLLRIETKFFIENTAGSLNMPAKSNDAIISIKNDATTTYETYITVYNEIYGAYRELRDEYAMSAYGKSFNMLNNEKKNFVKELYPIKISENEISHTAGFGDLPISK